MVRKGHGRQSLNSSVVTVMENSIVEHEQDYSEFVQRFRFDQDPDYQLIGCHKTISAIRERLQAFVDSANSHQFVLLTGPSGTGKTRIVRTLACQYPITFFYLKASWIQQKRFGDPELRIVSLFDEAITKAPSLIFIDRLDLICAEKRSQNDPRDKLFNILEDQFERLDFNPAKVLVMAATDRPEVLDPQVKKTSYFSDEIRFNLPSVIERFEILQHLTAQYQNNLTEEQLNDIANSSHCYSFVDLRRLYKMAMDCSKSKNQNILNYHSLKESLGQFKPVSVKSITTPCPPLRWQDIGGVDDVKRELQESVIWPLEHKYKFQRLGIVPNKGALLYGPPGCSKTMLAQALATESGYNFISIKGPELFSKFVGDSEAAVRKLYRNAREIAPCIIFFDEIDGFAPERNDNQSSSVGDKVVSQLLTELNGVQPLDNVYTIAATNRPDRVDSALLRPGRLNPSIYIPLPSNGDRREIFKVHMKPLALRFDSPVESMVKFLADKTNGYSGAEIANICRVAGTLALRESLDNEHIEWKHFENALEKVKPKTRGEHLKAYEKFQERTLQPACSNPGERTSQSADGTGDKGIKLANSLMRSLRIRKSVK